jgi:hypothetical protein
MIIENETPPSIAELLEAAPPTPQHIALNVRVTGRQGERAYWMTEGGTVFFRNLDGQLRRATPVQARRIMKGLELARRSPAYTVQGQVVEAAELDLVRGLVEN